MEQSELEYEDSEYETWVRSAVTRKYIRDNEIRLRDLIKKMESAAERSSDPDVRGAMAEVHATRVFLLELRDQRTVGGQQ